MADKDIIAFIGVFPVGGEQLVKDLAKSERRKLQVLLIRHSRKKVRKTSESVNILVECDTSDPKAIAKVLRPYRDRIFVISCRSESAMSIFARVLPHVPYVRTPTSESILWASDKLLMRRNFATYDKSITPKYAKVKDASKKEIKRIGEKIGFPLVVKPANLAWSMLVTVCYHEEELEKSIKAAFRKIRKIYAENDRIKEPELIVEQYMDGDMYSVDGYVTSRGRVYNCPIVRVVTGRSIGHDDFYNYMHTTIHSLKPSSVHRANEAVKKGVHALGLRSTSFHAEVIKIDDEWKIVEIGARVGGFRHKIYELSYGINHALNDILIRVPRKIHIPKRRRGYTTVLKYYPEKEGIITELKGIKKIQELKSFHSIVVDKKVGDRAKFAKNGGKEVFHVTLFNKDRSKLLADTRRVEKGVKITIE